MNNRSIAELFEETLVGGNGADDASWDAVTKLHRLGTREVFEQALEWSHSPEWPKRARAADVLGQLGKTVEHPSNQFPGESFAVLVGLLKDEEQPEVISAAVTALGHLYDSKAVPVIASFREHPDSEVRFAVAFGLGCFPNESLSVETLLLLTRDEDADVRDWATFGVGVQGDADSIELREAFIERLTDELVDAQEEAMVALAKRKDIRVMPYLLSCLRRTEVPSAAMEAAEYMLDIEAEELGRRGSDELAGELQRRFAT